METDRRESTAVLNGGTVKRRRYPVRDSATTAVYADAVRMADAFLSAAEHTGDWVLIRNAQESVAVAMERAWTNGGLTQAEIADLRGVDQSTVSSAITLLRRRRSAAQSLKAIGGNV